MIDHGPDPYVPLIQIICGDPGCGKTYYCMNHPAIPEEDHLIIDMEDRWQETLTIHCAETQSQFYVFRPLAIDDNMEKDAVTTLKNLNSQITLLGKEAKAGKIKKVVIFDGISDLKKMAYDRWITENPGRKRPSNPGDWSAINEMVREILERLCIYARIYRCHLIFTCLMADEYETGDDAMGKKTGRRLLDAPEFIKGQVDQILYLKIDDKPKSKTFGRYLLSFVKSLYGQVPIQDITEATE